MAKKKKRKEIKKKESWQIEINGILLILIAIIGCCKFKPVADIINGFAGFLVGVWWGVLLIIIGLIGAYMIVKREKPNFFTTRLVGLYIIVLGVLALSHMGYIKAITDNFKNDFSLIDILKTTFDNLLNFINNGLDLSGGGMIGALFSTLFIKTLTYKGAEVVSWVIILCGVIMFTGITIYDAVTWLKKGAKKASTLKIKAKDKEEIQKVENEYEKDDKIVVSSVDELIKEETKEVKQVEDEIEILDVKGYTYPPLNILKKVNKTNNKENEAAVKDTIKLLEEVFTDFAIEAKVVAVNIGPAVTQYEMEVKAGTKLSRILGINREIALALAAKDVRIEAPIPGKKTIGVEIPNKVTSMVSVREILETVPKNLSDSKLLVTLGRDIMGKPIYCEINKTPHLLVAGATGSGKSVCINSMIISLLMRNRPDEVKLVLVDPKKVELSMYNGAPHLLAPVVTDPRKANIVLKKIVVEMEHRYDLFEASGTKNIAGYNLYIEKKNKNSEDGQKAKLPYIVVIIDELADLMLVAAKEVEDSIMRITQMARAAGIHLIVATQRPSTDVITGLIKANIPSRISFAVSSSIDSRTILDMMGAEKLLGKGDMLFLPQGENVPIRVQGTWISDEEIKDVVDFTISQQKAHYDQTLSMSDEEMHATTMVEHNATEEPLYKEIVEFVVKEQKASASLLQRRFRLGYNRAARAIDLLEERGIVGPTNGSKPREVLVKLDKENSDE